MAMFHTQHNVVQISAGEMVNEQKRYPALWVLYQPADSIDDVITRGSNGNTNRVPEDGIKTRSSEVSGNSKRSRTKSSS